jgi:hypothetical protein
MKELDLHGMSHKDALLSTEDFGLIKNLKNNLDIPTFCRIFTK